MHLNEVENSITQETSACFEPALDYVALKISKMGFTEIPAGKHTAWFGNEISRRSYVAWKKL